MQVVAGHRGAQAPGVGCPLGRSWQERQARPPVSPLLPLSAPEQWSETCGRCAVACAHGRQSCPPWKPWKTSSRARGRQRPRLRMDLQGQRRGGKCGVGWAAARGAAAVASWQAESGRAVDGGGGSGHAAAAAASGGWSARWRRLRFRGTPWRVQGDARGLHEPGRGLPGVQSNRNGAVLDHRRAGGAHQSPR